MMIMGPPQQGHGVAVSLAAIADASSGGWAVVAAITTASDLRMVASFALR